MMGEGDNRNYTQTCIILLIKYIYIYVFIIIVVKCLGKKGIYVECHFNNKYFFYCLTLKSMLTLTRICFVNTMR